jgi:hypothetical protein
MRRSSELSLFHRTPCFATKVNSQISLRNYFFYSRIRSQEHRALITEYMGATGEKKLQLEKRYGKKQLTSMMNFMLSENYMVAML